MPVKTPTLEELGRIASRYGLSVTQDDLRSYQGLMGGMLASYNRLDQLPVNGHDHRVEIHRLKFGPDGAHIFSA